MKFWYCFVFLVGAGAAVATTPAQDLMEDMRAVDQKEAQDAIRTFQETKSEMERMQAADSLLLIWLRIEHLSPKAVVPFTPQQRAAIDAGRKHSQKIAREVETFEASLTASEIALVTSDNPSSLYRDIRRFSLLSTPKTCSGKAAAATVKRLGLVEAYERGILVMALAQGYESVYARRYCDKIVEILRARKKPTLVGRYLVSCRDFPPLGEVPEFVRRHENDLLASKIKPSELRPFVRRLAVANPDCLSSIDISFVLYVQREMARARGKALLNEIVSGVKKANPYLSERRDPWGHDYVVEKRGTIVTVTSPGRDYESDADDIVVSNSVR